MTKVYLARNTAETFGKHTLAMLAIESVLGPLSGFTVGLTSSVSQNLQSVLLASQGVDCITASVSEQHPVAPDRLADSTKALAEEDLDAIVFTSSLGVQLWFQLCSSLGIGGVLHDILDGVPVYAVGATTRATLAAHATESVLIRTDQLITVLSASTPKPGAEAPRAAVQSGGAASAAVVTGLRGAGLHVVEVPIYEVRAPLNTVPAERLFSAIRDGRLSALTFVSPDDVGSFFELATCVGFGESTVSAINDGLEIICLDSQTAELVNNYTTAAPLVPKRTSLGDLVYLVSNQLVAATRLIRLGGVAVRLQGNMATLNGEETVILTERERSVLDVLLNREGVVCSKDALLREVWGPAATDTHAVEVGIARLRRALGPAGAGIETVVRRGYRVRAERK